jgi:hypothetical protein
VTRYGLDGQGIEIPGAGDIFAPAQTGVLSYLASYKMGNKSSFLGVKRPGPSLDHPSLLALRLKKM